MSVLPKLEAAGVNVKVIAAISEELFDRQPESYRHAVLPREAYYDLMVVSTGTRRVWPLRDVGPLTDEYSMTSDWDHQWLTSGLEPDVIAEAHLDPASIFSGIQRFARDRESRLVASARSLGTTVERTLQRARTRAGITSRPTRRDGSAHASACAKLGLSHGQRGTGVAARGAVVHGSADRRGCSVGIDPLFQ